ncbi:MAG: SusC/RagA family TonB-linked outer membrane protein [Tannerella sp.]|jgi:TonB-linked SusC/RagA family outer membrane protein|nr:SusC/RagA family TonB-linked outer membrane protein [Tannerella sp.]
MIKIKVKIFGLLMLNVSLIQVAKAQQDIALPFAAFSKKKITSSDAMISGELLERYPTTDLRSAFSGIISGLEIVESNGQPGLSAVETTGDLGITKRTTMSLRGYSPIIIIDGLEADISEIPLDPDEIASVTVVKDIITKAMYGPKAANGILYIVTKHGRANVRKLSVNAETGISVVDRMPEWVSGAEYARLNNQARTNSGLTPLYSESDITAYSKNDPYDLYHPSINFRDMMFKDSRPFTRVNVSAEGGSDRVQYFAYLGYNGEGDNFKIGAKSDYHRVNARSNIDINITDDLKVGLGIFGGVTVHNSPNYSNSLTNLVEMNSLLEDINRIPPTAFPIHAYYDEINDVPWYGVSSLYGSNPFGNMESCGYYNELTRTSAANVNIDYDFVKLIPGLKSRTSVAFNLLNLTRIGKTNNYTAYLATPSKTPTGVDTILLSRVHDGTDNADQSLIYDYYYQRISFYEALTYEKTVGSHDLQLGLTYFLYNGIKDAVREPDRQQNGIFTASYAYQGKYSAQLALNYAGTSSFNRSNRYGLFPSLGVGWVVSDENSLKDNEFVDYLKLRLSAGILGYDGLATAFYYEDRWSYGTGTAFGPHSANQWFGADTESPTQSYLNRIANPDLTWEKRKEFDIGVEALLLDEKLYLELNYYNNTRDGIISKLANEIPYLTGLYYTSSSTADANPWYNYNKYRYTGAELTLQYSDNKGLLKYSFGVNANVRGSKVIKLDEPNYREDYLSKVGQSVNAIKGYTYLGKYLSDDEAQSAVQNFDQQLFAGDLKYEDKNNDGVIDANDQSFIGNSSPRLIYGLNFKIGYGRFELYALGTGRAFYDIALNNRYFQGSSAGDDTYSAFIRDNVGDKFPRLTYNRVSNNFQMSKFWLGNGNYFKLQNVELAYNIYPKKGLFSNLGNIKLYLRGANLLTFSALKDVDPEAINSGISVYPLFRTFTAGFNVNF